MKKNKQGFTLVEVIVVLIVLAILAVILVPQLTGYLDQAGERACQVNRASLLRYYKAANAWYYNDGGVTLNQFLENQNGKYDDFVEGNASLTCPSGGEYSVSADGLSITCSRHDDIMVGLSPAYNAYTDLNAAFIQLTGALALSGRIDSNAVNGLRTQAMLEYMAQQDPPVVLSDKNINSWSIQTEGGKAKPIYWWSDQSLDDVAVGNKIRVIRYNPNDNTYTAGYMKISSNTSNGATYKSINGGTAAADWEPVTGADPAAKDYASAVAVFNDLTEKK